MKRIITHWAYRTYFLFKRIAGIPNEWEDADQTEWMDWKE